MARIKLKLPEKFDFNTDIPLRITDINYGGHLGNDSVLALIHEARVRYLKQQNYSELDICGVGLIQSDAVVVYKSEAFYGDVINIQVAVGEFTATGCDFFFLLKNCDSGKEVARAKTGIAFFDYDKKKIAKVPENFLKKNS